jgi:methylenetetrahydrofolate dehydrogenase (NADP+)/methenyltetrahydrofolate cyclohydrolase
MMETRILDGKTVAAFHREKIENQLQLLRQQQLNPKLAILLIGADKPSVMYAKSMHKAAASIGLDSQIYELAEATDEAAVLDLIRSLNAAPQVRGILLMMPLPKHLDATRIVNAIDPQKDVDGLTDINISRLLTGRPGFVPCTPRAVMAILDFYDIDLDGQEVVIIGRSNVVGKPLAQLCLNRNATVTQCHSHTKELSQVTYRSDVLISAAGRVKLVTKDMVKAGTVVIDVGINRVDGRTVGDVDYEEVAEVAGAITKVPGGVGTVTTMMVLENVVCGPAVID